MEQFSLEKYLENPTRKVVTRNGKTVRIVCWDKLGEYPIVGCVKYSDDYEDLESYDINGFKYSFDREDQNDLFFADEEKELTEFEKELGLYIYFPKLSCEFNKDEKKYIRNAANTLFDLARKKLEPELDKKLKEAYNQGGLDTQEEITKCLPKWRNINQVQAENHYAHIANGIINPSGYFISYDDLETLPKEE